MKNIYTYPHKSKKSIIDYLVNHEAYGGWNHPNRGWSPLSWDVKVHRLDYTGGWRLDYHEPIDPLLDEKWDDYVRSDENVVNLATEDAQRQYLESEYCTHPGDDQGDWKFCFGGRSGGHLILKSWKSYDFLNMGSSESWEDYLNDLSFSDLTTLYKAVRCMDVDFPRENASKNVSYQLNFQRVLWESFVERGN
jgi:hypothetical protein